MEARVRGGQSGETVVELEGVFDREAAPAMRKTLLKIARKSEVKGLVIDLSRVSAVDTSGIAVLVEIVRLLSQKDRTMRLIGLVDSVRRMIRLTRLDQIFGKALA